MIGLAIILGLIALGFGARRLVERTFESASHDDASCGLTGVETAQRLLGEHATRIGVRTTDEPGWLTDHFDPRTGAIELSDQVGPERSVAAVAVAAHEAAHAMQSIERNRMFLFRASLTPASLVASVTYMFIPLIALVTFPFGLGGLLVLVAIIALSTLLLIEVIGLPVEVGASARALRMVSDQGLLTAAEHRLARRVLIAAALTYLVAALTTAALLILWLGGGDD